MPEAVQPNVITSAPGVAVPEIPAWLRGVLPTPDYQIKFLKPNGDVHFASHAGPQTWGLLCGYEEMCVGGRRGGGKSKFLIAKVAMGDLSLSEDDPARYSFLNDRDYRALLLREEYQSMAEFVEEAVEFYKPFGGKPAGDPKHIDFKSGARIYFNHLGDEEAFTKYKGWNLTFIGIEELTQIKTLRRYLKLLGSLRSVDRIRGKKHFPPLRTQIVSTTNPDGPGACVPYGEVMTPTGWKDIKSFKVGDPVFTVTPSGELAVSAVSQVHRSIYEGEMCYVNMRGFHMACTPNHQVAKIKGVRPGMNTRDASTQSPFSLVRFDELPGQAQVLRTVKWTGSPLPDFVPPRCETRQRKLAQPDKLSANNFCRLLGWFLSEGCTVDRDKAVNICQKKPESRDRLFAFLNDVCGFRFGWGASGALIHAPDWWLYFRQFGKAKTKFIPEWVKAGSVENLQHLLDALMDGDGHWETPWVSGTYYSISKQLADDVSEVALKLGFQVYVSRRVRHHSDNITYQVNIKRNALGGIEFQTGHHVYSVKTSVKRKKAATRRPFKSRPVYCIGVPDTHTFIIRQHGAAWISGNSWVKDRFVEVPTRDGKLIPWNTPMRDPQTGGIRIFIPFPIEANPSLSEDSAAGMAYRRRLMAQDEVTRKQWMDGDWNAGVGKFFKEYRPNGPVGKEEQQQFPWARHIIKCAPLKPWFTRWGSGDTGYEHPAAYHKFCWSRADKRVHVYDEMQLRRIGYFEQGAILAKWWLPELEGLQKAGKDPCITLYVGHDAFSKTDAVKTKAEQIQAGIREVLGPYGSVIVKYNEDERDAMERDPKRAKALFEMRRDNLVGHMRLALKPVYPDRIAAWGYIRDWLRFRPAILPLQTAEDREKYLRDVYQAEGREMYEVRAAELRNLKPEVLPKVQIWERCVELDRCLRVAQHNTTADKDPTRQSKREDVLKFNADDQGENGDDALESFRDGAIAFKEIEESMPKGEWIEERIENFQQASVESFGVPITDPTRLAMIAARQAELYQKDNPPRGGSFNIPRAAGPRVQ